MVDEVTKEEMLAVTMEYLTPIIVKYALVDPMSTSAMIEAFQAGITFSINEMQNPKYIARGKDNG